MRMLLSKWAHYTRLWLARRWCDPQLAEMAYRYGSVLVTSERHGKLILPLYHALCDGEISAELAVKLRHMTEERDYWKARASIDRTAKP